MFLRTLRRNPGTYTTKFELVESFRHHCSRCSYSGSMVCQWHHAPWSHLMGERWKDPSWCLKVDWWRYRNTMEYPEWKWELAGFFPTKTQRFCPDISVTFWNIKITQFFAKPPGGEYLQKAAIPFPPLEKRWEIWSKVVAVATGPSGAQCGRIDSRPQRSSWWLSHAWHLPASANEVALTSQDRKYSG